MKRNRLASVSKLQVVLLSVLAACVYGIIHDQITVRVCLGYFTLAHPPLFHTSSPTLLALCWGVAATAGIGVALGLLLAMVSQSHGAAPCAISRITRLILVLLGVMGASAFAAGIAGYQLSGRGWISLPAGLARIIPAPQHDRLMAVWFAHGASYLVGLFGGAILCFFIWQERGRPPVISFFPRTAAGVVRCALVAAVAAYLVWMWF